MAIFGFATTLRAICLSLLLLAGVNAQSTSPSNDTSPLQGDVGFLMSTLLNNMATTVKIVPLSNNAGLTGATDQLEAINPTGPLFLANANTVNKMPPGDIAYISCEPSDYEGEINAAQCINFAVNNRPVAIVLFSAYSARCSFTITNSFQYTALYTTEDANSSSAVLDGLLAASPPNPNTSIHVDMSTINGTSNNGSGDVLGRSPTTAVAMIILYSITGIITALFLIIIIVGAIRAHRHPERYGPRRIVGRPRQSRAKGIARAMLETLPIVKFGDVEEENKPADHREVMELGVTNSEHVENASVPTELPADNEGRTHMEQGEGLDLMENRTTKAAGVEQSAPKAENTVDTGTPAVDNGLACSVCVEDFEKGQDVRVLPCKHRFHPDCIDPWLLNVSGTCPLCRTDLRPTASRSEGDGEDNTASPATTSMEDGTTTAAVNETTRRNRRSRILHTLNIGRMTTATPEERLAALRMLRHEQMIGDSTPRARSRFSQRLSRTFGSRPQSGAGTPRRNSGIIANAETSPTAEAHPSTEMESTAEEPLASEGQPRTRLSPTTEVPPAEGTPQIREAHEERAPHAAGSAQIVEVSRPSAEQTIVEEKAATVDTKTKAEESHTSRPTDEAEATSMVASNMAEASDNQVAMPDTAHGGNSASTASSSTAQRRPSQPNIAPFYSYR